MTLALVIKEEVEEANKDIRLEVFRKVIKKDLEVSYWCNRVCGVFGDFKIHPDFRDELSSLKQFITLLTQKDFLELEETTLVKASDECTEFFFNQIIGLEKKYTYLELEELANHFAHYLYLVWRGGDAGGGAPMENEELRSKYFNKKSGIITANFSEKSANINC